MLIDTDCIGSSKSTNYHKLYRDGLFYLWRKPEYSEETTDLQKVNDKLDHIRLESSTMHGIHTHNFSGDRHSLHR